MNSYTVRTGLLGLAALACLGAAAAIHPDPLRKIRSASAYLVALALHPLCYVLVKLVAVNSPHLKTSPHSGLATLIFLGWLMLFPLLGAALIGRFRVRTVLGLTKTWIAALPVIAFVGGPTSSIFAVPVCLGVALAALAGGGIGWIAGDFGRKAYPDGNDDVDYAKSPAFRSWCLGIAVGITAPLGVILIAQTLVK